MNRLCIFLLSLLIAVATGQTAAAQTAPPRASAPSRTPGAVPYAFPGQWVLLGDGVGDDDDIVAYYYDTVRSRRAGNIGFAVWIAIDEKNVDGIRTNLYETEIDCSTRRARHTRVQNYDSAHYPLVTTFQRDPAWKTVPPDGPVDSLEAIICRSGEARLAAVSNVQSAALEWFRTRRAGPARHSLEPVSIADAQRQFASAIDGGRYTIGEGNPPGQWEALRTTMECVNRFRLWLPARTINGRTWPSGTSDYEVTWSRILSVEAQPGADYIRFPTAANPTFGFEVRQDKQPAAIAAARYLIAHCPSRAAVAPASTPAPANPPATQSAAASESPLLLHWEDQGQWRANRVWQPVHGRGISATLRTANGPSRGEISFFVQICNTGGSSWNGVVAFYENRDVAPAALTLLPGECFELQRTRPNGAYKVYVSVTKRG